MNSITFAGLLILAAVLRPGFSWGQTNWGQPDACSAANSALNSNPTRIDRLAAVIEASLSPETIGTLHQNARDGRLLTLEIKRDALNFHTNKWKVTRLPQGIFPDHYVIDQYAVISKASFPYHGFSIVESTDKTEAYLVDNASVSEAATMKANCPTPPDSGWTTEMVKVSDENVRSAIERAWTDKNLEKMKAEILKQ